MEKELQDKLKLVAEYDGRTWVGCGYGPSGYISGHCIKDEYSHGHDIDAEYHTSWDWQIPVWAKLYKHLEENVTVDFDDEGLWDSTYDYETAVHKDDPQEGFEIIVSIIQRIQQ